MNDLHIPVLLEPILDHIPSGSQSSLGLDVTFGRGGHTNAILQAHSNYRVLGVDRDPDAIEFGVVITLN
ncbi:MAG: 16S rRNA (cytosine(1402)-N(4))-methyltransferase [Bdellovibrionales bacterium]